MLNTTDLRFLIDFTLKALGYYSREAADLVLYTMATESQLHYLRQRAGRGRFGPACGLGQIEPDTARSIINDYIEYRTDIQAVVEELCCCDLQGMDDPTPEEDNRLRFQLMSNILLNIALVRIRYRWAPGPIPKTAEGMAEYWLKYYNAGGKGSVRHFLEAVERVKNGR